MIRCCNDLYIKLMIILILLLHIAMCTTHKLTNNKVEMIKHAILRSYLLCTSYAFLKLPSNSCLLVIQASIHIAQYRYIHS